MRARIEPVAIEELPAILPLWREGMAYHADLVPFFKPARDGAAAWERRAAVAIAAGEGAVFAALTEGQPAGFIFGLIQSMTPVLEPGKLGYIVDLYVREEYRRHGLGRLLFLTLRDWFRNKGIDALDLHVYLANAEAVAFWRSLGFEPYAQRMRMEIQS